LQKLLDAQRIYRTKLKAADKDALARPVPLTREVIIAESDEQARQLAEQHLLVSYRDEYASKQWKHPLIGAEDSTPADRLDAISRDRFLLGSPDTVITQLHRFQAAFGVDHIICRLYFPGIPHEFILNELRLLAAEVLPEFRRM
jgi:alkanesulfonate monooxygenase SsuD/methylene tetrahydromethanopterin reductase-like flavin-dependent oxidoreductase (luciferase family)